MSLASELAGAVDELIDAMDSPTFVWNGVLVPCVPNTFGRRTVLIGGGFEVEADARLFVRRNEFLTADSTLITVDSELFTADNDLPTPVAGKTLRFPGGSDSANPGGRTYRIEMARMLFPADTSGNDILELILIDPNK